MQKSGIEINAINISTKENVDKKEATNVKMLKYGNVAQCNCRNVHIWISFAHRVDA